MPFPKTLTLTFGLSADPVHNGHQQALSIAIDYIKNHRHMGLKRVMVIPVYVPNLISNKKKPAASYSERVWMCQLMAQNLREKYQIPITVSRIEKRNHLQSRKPNYSFNTLTSIAEKNIGLLISADHFSGTTPSFQQWYRWQDIIKKFHLIISQRPHYPINPLFIKQLQKQTNHPIHILNQEVLTAASSDIRKHIRKNGYTSYIKSLLDKKIYQYIKKKKLYYR